MNDGIIKGVGNSRYLKSVASFLSLYPTYEAFAQALIEGTLPVDFNGINEAGWSQLGTTLNKANLLTDATAALFGLGTAAVPDDALSAIKTLINSANTNANSKLKVEIGSYVGTGTYGESNPTTITFETAPTLLIIPMGLYKNSYTGDTAMTPTSQYHQYQESDWTILPMAILTTTYQIIRDGYTQGIKASSDKKTVYFYHSQAAVWQKNEASTTYYYYAIS